jgi:hypothetical protein
VRSHWTWPCRQQRPSTALEAFEVAEAADLPEAQAGARAVQSLIAYYGGHYHDALAFARDGYRRAPGSSQTVRLAINGEARALARLGDRAGVDNAVDRAFAALGQHTVGADVSPSLALTAYCPARTAANAATAYLALGCSDKSSSTRLKPWMRSTAPGCADRRR